MVSIVANPGETFCGTRVTNVRAANDSYMTAEAAVNGNNTQKETNQNQSAADHILRLILGVEQELVEQ